MRLSRREFVRHLGVLGGSLLLPGTALSQSRPAPPGNLRMSGGGKTTYVADTGNSITNGTNLQAALDVAVGGETIELTPGATYQGPVYFRNRGNTSKITLRTAGYGGAGWPASGTKVTPSHARLMATLLPPQNTVGNSSGAIHWNPNADNYAVQGIQVLGTSNDAGYVNYGLLWIWAYPDYSAAAFPRNATVQHCLLRGHSTYSSLIGIRVNAHNVTIRDCYFDRFWSVGMDGQILELSGGSHLLVQNCHLEGATENIMVGGNTLSDPSIQAQDVTIRYCTFLKPSWVYRNSPDWNGTIYCVKNLFEVKGGRRITVEGCDFSNFYNQSQAYPWVITVRREGNPWMDIQDVVFRNCRINGTPSILNTLAYDDLAPGTEHGKRLTVDNCLFYNIDLSTRGAKPWDGTPLFQTQFDDITIKHCTWWKSGAAPAGEWSYTVIESGDSPNLVSPRFTFKDNIGMVGIYGARTSISPGSPWLVHFCSNHTNGTQDWTCANNILCDGVGANPPTAGKFASAGNTFPASSTFFSEFVNPAAGNFSLKPGSGYKGTSSDGKDPGVDMDALEAALAGIK